MIWWFDCALMALIVLVRVLVMQIWKCVAQVWTKFVVVVELLQWGILQCWKGSLLVCWPGAQEFTCAFVKKYLSCVRVQKQSLVGRTKPHNHLDCVDTMKTYMTIQCQWSDKKAAILELRTWHIRWDCLHTLNFCSPIQMTIALSAELATGGGTAPTCTARAGIRSPFNPKTSSPAASSSGQAVR